MPDALNSSMHLNLRQLEIFRAVAESGSIRAASRRVHLTQPAVTHAVRELERCVGAPLFTRDVKGVIPTDVGEALLRRTHLLFNEVQRMKDEILQVRDGTGGRLSIAFSSASAQLLPVALERFRALRPSVTLDLHEISQPDVDAKMRIGRYDFAVISDWGETAYDGLVSDFLFEQPLAVVARTGHPLAQVRSVSRLQHCTWLISPGYGLPMLRKIFAAKRLKPPTDVITCQSAIPLITLLYRTDAVALISGGRQGLRGAAQGLTKLPIMGALDSIRISVIYPEVQALSPAATVFIDCLRIASTLPKR
ncbi:LysR family transcriptional regulator [Acidovorax sp. D2M1]|uniref:LysR family transcriptional regulator n=1 Tax=Acidovorax benzenivorans TaxID=2987520 RepID=A0ABT5S3V9_9BURK|nr:LysR family transcriptional regulator [Acidovorax benzenivorans]MDD2180643.1 LysR family transcriptional regulator [Acidovorax benzenivorans]